MLILLILLLVLFVGGIGFALHFLWFVAAVFFVLWLIGFLFGRKGGGRHRFYRW